MHAQHRNKLSLERVCRLIIAITFIGNSDAGCCCSFSLNCFPIHMLLLALKLNVMQNFHACNGCVLCHIWSEKENNQRTHTFNNNNLYFRVTGHMASFIHSFIHPCIHSYTHSFIQSFIRVYFMFSIRSIRKRTSHTHTSFTAQFIRVRRSIFTCTTYILKCNICL